MTTEDDFQRALDEQPDDWHTRLVFADWLEDRSDPRAEGYRALGVQRVQPIRIRMERSDGRSEGERVFIYGTTANDSTLARDRWGGCFLPRVWFQKLRQLSDRDRNPWWRYFATRREAEDAAAISFAHLGKSSRVRLLAAPAAPQTPAETAEQKPARPRKRTKR